MKKIGFVGAFEKTDLMIYVAKILTEIGNRVLIIDATILQNARYIVPAVTQTKTYVTTCENIDVAVGFREPKLINDYLGDIENSYDFVLIDIDTTEMFNRFDMQYASKLYFVTAFDNFSLKRGIGIIGHINQPIRMTKVFFERGIRDEHEEYLNLLSSSYLVEWNEERIYFPQDQGDLTAIIENQRAEKINLKILSDSYRVGLQELVQDLEPNIRFSDIKKIIKRI